MGHFFYPHPIPVTETQKHSAYPGCYALSKVLEEVMLEQYYIQYGLERLLPARALDHGEGRLPLPALVRRGRVRRSALARSRRARGGRRLRRRRARCRSCWIPTGVPVKRNFVHVDDLVRGDPAGARPPARAPADVQRLHGRAGRLRRAGRVPGEDARAADRCRSARPTDSTWLDNSKAKFLLGWRPALRPRAHDRRRLRLPARGRRSARHLVPRVSGRGRLP